MQYGYPWKCVCCMRFSFVGIPLSQIVLTRGARPWSATTPVVCRIGSRVAGSNVIAFHFATGMLTQNRRQDTAITESHFVSERFS
jgi:hypothetical protein